MLLLFHDEAIFMYLSEEEFAKLTHLCKIACDEEEKQQLLQNITKVLSYIEQLDELCVQDVSPCTQVIASLHNVMREDEEGPLLSREEFLANAPSHIGGMIRVPSILKTAT